MQSSDNRTAAPLSLLLPPLTHQASSGRAPAPQPGLPSPLQARSLPASGSQPRPPRGQQQQQQPPRPAAAAPPRPKALSSGQNPRTTGRRRRGKEEEEEGRGRAAAPPSLTFHDAAEEAAGAQRRLRLGVGLLAPLYRPHSSGGSRRL